MKTIIVEEKSSEQPIKVFAPRKYTDNIDTAHPDKEQPIYVTVIEKEN